MKEQLTKICSKCRKEKSINGFHKNIRSSDGFATHCKKCTKDYQKKWYLKNRERLLIKQKEWNKCNPDYNSDYYQENKEYLKKHREKNKDIISRQRKKYREENKEKISKHMSEYFQKNKSQYYARSRKRMALKINATVEWANYNKIKKIYESCPNGYHVDHIVPLKSKIVCGLHCEDNLQHLPASENAAKGNRYWPDMP